MKRLAIILGIASFFFASCNVGDPGLDGDAFVKINWNEKEPKYVHTDMMIPWTFDYDTYYRSSPGEYLIEFGYEYEKRYETVVYPYSVSVEIWVEEGEYGRTHGRDGRDARNDVYFDIDLYPDGDIDFVHELVQRDYTSSSKSATVDTTETDEKTLVSQTIDYQGNYGFKYTVYRHPAYIK